MAFTLATEGVASSSAYNELAGYFNGSSSYPANPMQLITFNDATNYVQSWKNLDTTNGRVGIFYKADGTVLAKITKDGFRFSPNGVIEDLTPVSLSGTEAITGPKTFTRLILKRATSTVAAASLTLPTDGNIVPITGTTSITSISGTGNTSVPITLEFASDGCIVRLGASHHMQGDFISKAGGTLTLEYDGSAWHELHRGAHIVPGARFFLNAATTSIVQGAVRVVTWTNNDVLNGGVAASGTISVADITPGILGRWLVHGEITWDLDAATEDYIGFLRKNGTIIRRLFDFISAGVLDSGTGGFSTQIEVTSITDTYDLVLFTTNTCNIIGGAEESHLAWSWVGR